MDYDDGTSDIVCRRRRSMQDCERVEYDDGSVDLVCSERRAMVDEAPPFPPPAMRDEDASAPILRGRF